jgi:hypothetical protein
MESSNKTEAWRRWALGLLLLGLVGVALELVLLEHFEGAWQWTPLVLLGVGVPVAGALAMRPTRAAVRTLQVLMLACVLAGGLGVVLHLRSNIEFERELRPSIAGRALNVETLNGAIPALAPGAMAQLGLLGLLICYRHPLIHPGRGDER